MQTTEAQSELDRKAQIYLELREKLFKFGCPAFFDMTALNLETTYFEAHIKKAGNIRKIISKASSPMQILAVLVQKITGISAKVEVDYLGDLGEEYKCTIRLEVRKNKNKAFVDQGDPLFQVQPLASAKINTLGRPLAKEIFAWRMLEIYFTSFFNTLLELYPLSNLQKHLQTLSRLASIRESAEESQLSLDSGLTCRKLISVISLQNEVSSGFLTRVPVGAAQSERVRVSGGRRPKPEARGVPAAPEQGEAEGPPQVE